jgi:hypothetical protein
MSWRNQELLKVNSTQKVFHGPKHANCSAVDERVLESVLEKCKNGLSVI